MFTFSYIWVFILLPLPLIMRKFTRPYQEKRQAVRAPFFEDLVKLSGQEPGTSSVVRRQPWLRQIITTLAWILLLVGTARPQWVEPPIVKQIPSRDLLLAVDLSGSMESADFTGKDGKKIDRLAAVKEVLDDFLQHRSGDRVGLIFFGSAPFIQAPFTEDLDTCRQLLQEAQVRMAGPKTAIGDTIGLAINMFKESAVKEKLLILLTDGNDTGSRVDPVTAARIARDNKIMIITVAVGDPEAVGEEKLDVKTLEAVAETTEGSYFWAGDREALARVYERIDELSTHEIQSISYRPRIDLYFYPLGLAIAMSLLLHFFRIFQNVFKGSIRAKDRNDALKPIF